MPRPFRPALSIRTAEQNALAALARGDSTEFERLTLDVAGLTDRVDHVAVVRAELRLRAARTASYGKGAS